jgi:hypothetical protein
MDRTMPTNLDHKMLTGFTQEAQSCLPTIRAGIESFLHEAQGAALLEHYVCVISPVEDESLSPDVAQVMYVSVRWPWRSGLHGAA